VSKKKIQVTLIKSPIRRHQNHKACAVGLGLRKVNSSSIVEDTPAVRGMINKISYLVSVKEA